MSRVILLVEDDKVLRQHVLAPRLVREGYQVLEAGKVSEAEAHLEASSPALMIVDGLLPDRTGVDFVRALKEKGSTVPVIFLSSFWKDMASFQRLKELGVAHILRKPVEIDDLCRKVKALLEPGSQTGGERAPADELAPVFDPSVMVSTLGDDPELIREIVDAYFQTMPQLAADLDEAQRQGSAERVVFCAHSIKGAAANLGAKQLQQVAAELEMAARQADLAVCASLGPRVTAALAALERELRERFGAR